MRKPLALFLCTLPFLTAAGPPDPPTAPGSKGDTVSAQTPDRRSFDAYITRAADIHRTAWSHETMRRDEAKRSLEAARKGKVVRPSTRKPASRPVPRTEPQFSSVDEKKNRILELEVELSRCDARLAILAQGDVTWPTTCPSQLAVGDVCVVETPVRVQQRLSADRALVSAEDPTPSKESTVFMLEGVDLSKTPDDATMSLRKLLLHVESTTTFTTVLGASRTVLLVRVVDVGLDPEAARKAKALRAKHAIDPPTGDRHDA